MTQIGLVIPTYNRLNNLKLLLKSLEIQTTKNFFVVIADDGSTDGTREYIGEISNNSDWEGRMKWIGCGPNNKGRRGRTRNIGAANLPKSCTLMVMLDSDIILQDDAISVYTKIHKQNPDQVVFGMVDWLPPLERSKVENALEKDDFDSLKALVPDAWPERIEGTFVGHELRSFGKPLYTEPLDEEDKIVRAEWSLFLNAGFPLKSYWEIGGFDERMEGYGYEDMEIGARSNIAKIPCSFEKDIFSLHIWHSKGNADLCLLENQKNLDYFLRKHGFAEYYASMIEWQYWWHYTAQRSGKLVKNRETIWAINYNDSKRIEVPTLEWVTRMGYSQNDIKEVKKELLDQIEIAGKAYLTEVD